MLFGTSSSTSWLPRAISGSMMIASAIEPAKPVCCLLGSTSRPKTKRPTMIEGRPFIRSSVSRIGPAIRLPAYSVRKSAIRTPSGIAISGRDARR